MKPLSLTGVFPLCLLCLCCTPTYTPKPRGYFRIEPPPATYVGLQPEGIPGRFHVSTLARVEYPREKDRTGWINLYYPTLEAGIYCSYLSVTPATIRAVEEESYALLYRQTPSPQRITEQTYENRQTNVYAGLYVSPASPASPLQFVLTDGQKHFFRGTLVYNRPAPADSLAPVTDYLKADLQELIQSFQWEKSHAALPPA